jgi:hypothetical protein
MMFPIFLAYLDLIEAFLHLGLIMKHADTYNILYPLQHGFRKGLSSETQLIECVDDITRNIDAGKQTDCLVIIKKEISWGLGLSLGVLPLPIAPVSYLMTLLQ